MSKTHWKNLTNTNYLGSYSFDNQNEVTVTIKSVNKEKVINPVGVEEECIVVAFEETKVGSVDVKPMIFNVTNCKTVEKLYGPYIEEWVGKRITIFKTQTDFGRDRVDCLRIRDKVAFVAAEAQKYHCSVCGKEISKKMYDASVKQFGVAVCSKECSEKINTNNEEENK